MNEFNLYFIIELDSQYHYMGCIFCGKNSENAVIVLDQYRREEPLRHYFLDNFSSALVTDLA